MTYLIVSLLLALAQTQAQPPALTRQPRHGGVYVVAHRGVHDGIPENTLAAYRRAIELGADFVEIDLRETKDGHLVSIHDHTVDAYTQDATGPVHEFTLAELKALDIGRRVGPEWAEERIPTFEEILKLCKGNIGIYLDLKQGNVETILATAKRFDMVHDILWYAGTPLLRQLRELCPECHLMPDPGAEQNLSRILDAFAPRIVASVWRHITESFVERCHEAGAIVIVDDGGPETWDTLLSWRVDGIQTDHVSGLIERLRQVQSSGSPAAIRVTRARAGVSPPWSQRKTMVLSPSFSTGASPSGVTSASSSPFLPYRRQPSM